MVVTVLCLCMHTVVALPSYTIRTCSEIDECTYETSSLPLREAHVDDYAADGYRNNEYIEELKETYHIDVNINGDYSRAEIAYFLSSLDMILSSLPGKWLDVLTDYERVTINMSPIACESYGCVTTKHSGTPKKQASITQTISVNGNSKVMYAAILHELAHAFYHLGTLYYTYLNDSDIWSTMGTTLISYSGGTYPGTDKASLPAYTDHFVSSLAATSIEEDYAESLLLYLLEYSGLNSVAIDWTEYTKAKAKLVASKTDALIDKIIEQTTYKKPYIIRNDSAATSVSIHKDLVADDYELSTSKLEKLYASDYASFSGIADEDTLADIVYKNTEWSFKEQRGLRSFYQTLCSNYFVEYMANNNEEVEEVTLNQADFYKHIGKIHEIAFYVEDVYVRDKKEVFEYLKSSYMTTRVEAFYTSYVVANDATSAEVISEAYLKYLDSITPKSETIEPSTIKTPTTSDLYLYSAFNMNVYPSSRVTSIEETDVGFRVKGYMFEANANCKDSLWREIVFVSTDSYDFTHAYRKQVTSIYNTWLNSNATATANGKYTLDYANYSVAINPYDMNSYVGNAPHVAMESGSYYVYMRISNGYASYLFPLTDTALSDGTTMENSGTLPKGFSVYDLKTRALLYTTE